jgi:long-chain acyl-CoA synthetase
MGADMGFSMEHLLCSHDAGKVQLEDGKAGLDRGQLLDRIARVGELLGEHRLSRIAVHADNTIDWVLLDLACMDSQVMCLPLPLNFTPDQITHACNSCAIEAVFTSFPALFAGKGEQTGQSVFPGLTMVKMPAMTAPRLPLHTAKVTFTSGSTGTPKGVCLGVEQEMATARALRDSIGIEQPRHLCVLPLSTLLENIAGVYAPLLAGGSVILRSLAELGFGGSRLAEPGRFLQCITETRPDSIILIPQLLHVLVQAAQQGWQAPSLKFIAVGGSKVSPHLLQQARELGLPVYEGYGLSECGSVVSLNTPASDKPGSAGQVLPNVQVRQDGGELLVSGNLMLGYVNEPQSWYSKELGTGDLGTIDAGGFVHLSGRSRNTIISSYGRNISPEWVESELLASPILAEAVVTGDARSFCVALLSPRQAGMPDHMLDMAVNAANARLPDYARVVRWYRLPKPLAATPGLMTSNGRPRRPEIEAAYASEIENLYADSLAAVN